VDHSPEMDVPDVVVGRAWREHRRHVLDVAFRMLGNLAEAEDVVQEAYARLVRADVDAIDDVGGWLVVVASRLCLDRLRAERRHPTAPDDDLGARAAPAGLDPADRVTLDDRVRLALHVVLERLTAAERTAFVLHDVFQYPFEAIAEIVGRSPAACRQLASRARRAVRDAGPARFVVEPAEQRRVTERFIAACTSGDLDGLLAVLDPDVDGVAAVGGPVGTRVAEGRDVVMSLMLRYLGPGSGTTLLSLPGGDDDAVLVGLRGPRVVLVASVTVRDGRIVHFDGIADPARLAPLGAYLGSRQDAGGEGGRMRG
jgi:RNA polymerase sigma-70 factor (ECF subfamily)